MKSITVKVILGALGAVSVATGVAFANLPDNYESYLKKQGRELLTKDSQQWEVLKTKYSEEGDDLLITIDEKEGPKKDLNANQFKEWCLANNNKAFTNTKDEIYQRVSAWCTEPKTITQKIGLTRKILDDKESPQPSEVEQLKWKNKLSSYNSSSDTKQRIKEITSNKVEGEKFIEIGSAEEAMLKAWCRFSKDKHFKHEEDQRYNNYLLWCTEQTYSIVKNASGTQN